MILSRRQIGLVLAGRRDLLLLPRVDGGPRPPHGAGASVALQPGATKRATCRVQVARVTDIALGELGEEEARRLGERDLEALMVAWVAERGLWNENDRAWLLTVVVDPSARPVFLARRPRSTNGSEDGVAARGYTHDERLALSDEPEAVHPDVLHDLQRSAHETARSRYEGLLRERSRMPVEERLRLVMADADLRGVQFGRDVRVVEDCVRSMERRVYRPAHLRAA